MNMPLGGYTTSRFIPCSSLLVTIGPVQVREAERKGRSMTNDDQSEEAQKSTQPAVDERENERSWTDFGYGFACVLAALLLLFAPWYFFGDPFPGNAVVLVFSLILYVAGLIVLLFGIGFFSTGMQKTPELRQLFPTLSAGEDAWQGTFGAIVFLMIIAIIQLLIYGFEMAGIVAVAAKLLIYFMAVLAITQVAQAIDGFVIRPLIAAAGRGPQEFEPLIKRVRQVGIAIGFIVAFVAGIATIIDVF
jgi:hypothetical protein